MPRGSRVLTKREEETLGYLKLGLQNKEIAERMGISPNTVRSLMRKLSDKFNAKTRTQIVSEALTIGNPRDDLKAPTMGIPGVVTCQGCGGTEMDVHTSKNCPHSKHMGPHLTCQCGAVMKLPASLAALVENTVPTYGIIADSTLLDLTIKNEE